VTGALEPWVARAPYADAAEMLLMKRLLERGVRGVTEYDGGLVWDDELPRRNPMNGPYDYDPEYPKIGVLVEHDGELAKVLDTYTPYDDAVPDWTEEESELDVLIQFDAGRKKKAVPVGKLIPFDGQIAEVDVDEAWYVGDEDDGVYVQTAKGPDGWYVSGMVDSDTGSFVDDFETDAGPFDTEKEALSYMTGSAADWYYENVPPERFGDFFPDPICPQLHKKIGW
jgi:hypothetical protein